MAVATLTDIFRLYDMENKKNERHPFTPFLPDGCKIVMCSTFPPKPEKWSMDFFYPNFQNKAIENIKTDKKEKIIIFAKR